MKALGILIRTFVCPFSSATTEEDAMLMTDTFVSVPPTASKPSPCVCVVPSDDNQATANRSCALRGEAEREPDLAGNGGAGGGRTPPSV